MLSTLRLFSSVLVVLMAGVTGCAAPKHWAKDGATEADFNRDSWTCAQAAAQQEMRHVVIPAGQIAVGVSKPVTAVNKDLYRACMQAYGYQRVEGGTWIGIKD